MTIRVSACLVASAATLFACGPTLTPNESGNVAEYEQAPPNKNSSQKAPPVIDEYSAYLVAPVANVGREAVQDRVGGGILGRVASIDERRGVPNLFFSSREEGKNLRLARDPATAALDYLDQHREIYDLSESATLTAHVERVLQVGESNVVAVEQSVDGIPVYRSRMSFLMRKDQELVAISGSLHPEAVPGGAIGQKGELDGTAAIARAYADATGESISAADLTVVSRDSASLTERVTLGPGMSFLFSQPAAVRDVLFPLPKALVRAYHVEFELASIATADSRAYSYVIAADGGGILERRNLTHSEAFEFRVWADEDAPHRPFDGPHGDHTPHPTGTPEPETELVPIATNLVAVDAFNTNPDGSSDPWLPASSQETRGNNVDAYADHATPSGFGAGDLRAVTTGSRSFDYPFDTTIEPFENETQVSASVVQLFYVNNWLHDWFYDSGFNEAAGVAQLRNFERGGVEGDPLLAEAQDRRGDALNNANMSTPSDGLSPRMQMYLWSGDVEIEGESSFKITSPPELAGDRQAAGSMFGVGDRLTATGPLALAADAGGEKNPPEDGCEEIVSDVAGKVAILNRGNCSFVQKAKNVEKAGAIGLVIVNQAVETPDDLPPLGGSDRDIAIPVLGISLNTGKEIRVAMETGDVVVEVARHALLRDPFRDGTLDNSIVAHEWGHYFHHRLSVCGGTSQCGGMSEGWGDFVALYMHLREGDDLDATYAAAAYATNDAYFGIRRVPYSVDFTRNALTFRHIGDGVPLPENHPIASGGRNSEVHNAGEIWTSMLWEAYIALLREGQADGRLTFAEAQRRFADYMVGGLLMAPTNATYTEVRDSILAAAAARDERDLEIMARAFARRGAGSGAVSPARDSSSLTGVIESYVIGGELTLAEPVLAITEECDGDGVLDHGDMGTVSIRVTNTGPVALAATHLEVSEEPGIEFPEGLRYQVPELAPYQTTEVVIPVKAVAEGDAAVNLVLTVSANDPGSVNSADSRLIKRLNYDNRTTASTHDDVESDLSSWSPTAEFTANGAWLRTVDATVNTVWHAPDLAERSDLSLISPALEVGEDALVVSYDYRHRFEANPDNPDTPEDDPKFWDGAVVEISFDEQRSWHDVREYGADPGYGGLITDEATNPLGGRRGLVAQNKSWPGMSTATLNLGTRFSNRTVYLRFRVGTDVAVGDHGLEIDNISVTGIENQPFAVVDDEDGICLRGGALPSGGCSSSGGASGALTALLFLAAAWYARRRRVRVTSR